MLTTQKAEDLLLQSYDVFNIENPLDVFGNLRDCKKEGANPKINSNAPTHFNSEFTEAESKESIQESIATSVGISGEYAVYSGSVKFEHSQQSSKSYTTFNAIFKGKIRKGGFYYADTDPKLKDYLKADLLNDLEAVASYEQAREFTNTWGTHLLTGIKTGGEINVIIEANTQTLLDKRRIAAEMSAKYSGVASVEATGSVAQELERQYGSSFLSQSIETIGGDPNSPIGVSANDKSTFTEWAKTVSEDSVRGIQKAKTFWELASDFEMESSKWLKNYVNSCILRESIQYPRVFTASQDIRAQEVRLTCKPEDILSNKEEAKHYKIIGGGAEVTWGSNNFITTIAPLVSGSTVKGWEGASFNMEGWGNDAISVYAIGIYDPFDMLEVKVVEQKFKVRAGGNESREFVAMPKDYQLVGGGVSTETKTNGRLFVYWSYPLFEESGNAGWQHLVRDWYDVNGETEVTGYALGMKVRDPDIATNLVSFDRGRVDSDELQSQHGDATVTTDNSFTCGGVKIYEEGDARMNRLQACFPTGHSSWTIRNKDHGGHPGIATAMVRTLDVSPVWHLSE